MKIQHGAYRIADLVVEYNQIEDIKSPLATYFYY